MSESRYSVVFSGQIKPDLTAETVTSNLVLDIGLEHNKAVLLLRQGRVVLKRCDTIVEAQRLAEKFDRSGAICFIEDRFARESSASQASSNESSLVKLINKFIPSSRQPAASSASRK